MKWILSIILLLIAGFAAMKAEDVSRQVLDSLETMGSDGKDYVSFCRPFDCKLILSFYRDSETESRYPMLAGHARRLEDEIEEYQEKTFAWGTVSALMLGGIAFLFLRPSRPRQDDPTPRPRNPFSISS
jgi:hypothetical protein